MNPATADRNAEPLDLHAAPDNRVYACYQCAKCSSTCPYGLEPHQIMRLLQMGRIQQAAQSSTIDDCASCMNCTRVCPKSLNPMRAIHMVGQSKGKKVKGLRSRIFANIHALSRLGSRYAPLSNRLLRLPGAALVNHYLLGIHKQRALPPYAVIDFPTWFRQHQPEGSGSHGTVVLFHDTFMDYNFPEIGIAATRVLERAGYKVELADMVCCGRPMISKGFTEQAIWHITQNVNRLYPAANEGKWIVGCEPSCLLGLRDDYLELAPPDLREKAHIIASRALLIDEFLEVAHERNKCDLRFRGPDPKGPSTLVFHSHCHQKALADPACARRLLERAGYEVIRVCANCCGMAGSYGAEREHFERSRQTFEEGVGLALRNHPDAGIAIMGVSCRLQITDLATGPRASSTAAPGPHTNGHAAAAGPARRPRHIVEWLSDALAAEGQAVPDLARRNGSLTREGVIMSR
jgi:Fe-S oxidoreductase